MERTNLPLLAGPLLFALSFGCGSIPPGERIAPVGHDPLMLATLYAQTSAEFEAAARMTYAAARDQLEALLADTSRTAALEQEVPFAEKPPAIVFDVDETVLDNSAYEVRLIEDGARYPTGWDDWCNESAASTIPGAVEFARFASECGVTLFYVTNRKAHLEQGTRRNLASLGFPLREGIDVVLMADERPAWTSDKTSRRKHVAEGYRIVMLFGDNMGDFIAKPDAQGSPTQRRTESRRHAGRWGRTWFMLPNPMYGYWAGAALAYDYDRTDAELGRLRLEALDSKR